MVRSDARAGQIHSARESGLTDAAGRFRDPREAGRALASELDARGGAEAFGGAEALVVVAIAHGGVPLAAEVARRLRAPLDVALLRRLLVPEGPGSQVCAVSVCGTLVLDEELPPRPGVPQSPLDYFVADALDGLARRERACRGARPARDLAGKSVILVDNGIRTGLTMLAVIRALRTLGPSRVLAAVPVSSSESRGRVEAAADELVCLAWPEPFGHVGMWYADFTRPDEAQIRETLEESERTRD